MATLDFNASEVSPLEVFEAIPNGEYEAVITESDMKPNKANTGAYLELKTEIVSGDHAGRKLTVRLNLHNPSQKAVEMARRELSSILDMGRRTIRPGVWIFRGSCRRAPETSWDMSAKAMTRRNTIRVWRIPAPSWTITSSSPDSFRN